MSKIKIFQIDFQKDFIPVLAAEGDYSSHNLTTVEDMLEMAYHDTQNIHGSWSRGETFEDGTINQDFHKHLTIIQPLHEHNGKLFGLRSSMIGDFFLINDRDLYKVGSFGFDKVEDKINGVNA